METVVAHTQRVGLTGVGKGSGEEGGGVSLIGVVTKHAALMSTGQLMRAHTHCAYTHTLRVRVAPNSMGYAMDKQTANPGLSHSKHKGLIKRERGGEEEKELIYPLL